MAYIYVDRTHLRFARKTGADASGSARWTVVFEQERYRFRENRGFQRDWTISRASEFQRNWSVVRALDEKVGRTGATRSKKRNKRGEDGATLTNVLRAGIAILDRFTPVEFICRWS